MNNKLHFIMPRLLGATVVAGLAALVIITLFKILLGVTLLAGAVTLIARSVGRRQKQFGVYGQDAMPGLGNSSAWSSPVQQVTGYASQKGASIVPIN